MSVRLIDDFTGEEIPPGHGWALQGNGRVYHVRNLSGLLKVLATQATAFGVDEEDGDKAFAKSAGLRVSKAPAPKKKGSKPDG